MTSPFENLEVVVSEDGPDAGIAQVTIQRPKAMNALNDQTMAEIDRCFRELRDDARVRVVVLTGAGSKAFVAGADISELAEQTVEEAQARSTTGQRAFDRIEQLGKPVLAAINGFALGGGLELALACHVRYASTSARLGLPEVTLALIPGFGGTQRLARVIGGGRALEWVLSGDMYGAEEAHRVGLVNRLFAPEELLSGVMDIARTLCSRGPLAQKSALEAVLGGWHLPLAEGQALEARLFGDLAATADMREGTAAFLEKRKARFQGI